MAGTKFGRYEIEEEVARGGMGVIYRVRDPEMRRFLALKVLRDPAEEKGEGPSTTRTTKLSARFVDEAQLTGQLDHPGIIPVYDMGRGEDGRLYFTMRLVKGRTLEEVFALVKSGAEGWSVTRALGVLQKVCEAMAFAHERDVIHRDLKPSNVMVGRFGETYVMDWGIAKIVGEETAQAPALETPVQTVLSSTRKDGSSHGSDLETLEGDVMGTPAYMAPEQARGQVGRVGPAADVYAVGAMLYHLLAGHTPYFRAGAELSARDVHDGLLAGPPEALAKVARDAPPELCAICERAMERDPERRYPSMLALAEDLQAYLEHRVVQAYRRGAGVELRKWIERNRATAASLALALLLGFGGLVAVSLVQSRGRNALAEANRELETTNRALGEANRDLGTANEALADANRRVEAALLEAKASEAEARWQSYAANVTAASANLEAGGAQGAAMRLAACDEGLRAWEWHYLQNRLDSSLLTIQGSEEISVGAVAYSPDGRYVASGNIDHGTLGSDDFAVRIWRTDTGELVHELEGHRELVLTLEFSPSGSELASGGFDAVRLWDVASGDELAVTRRWGSKIAYHPDGLRLAIGADSGFLRLWNSLTDELELEIELQGREGVRCIDLSDDGRLLAAGSFAWGVLVFDLDTGELVRRIDLASEARSRNVNSYLNGVLDVEFAPAGDALLVALSNHDARVLDLETGETRFVLSGHSKAVTAAAFDPDGSQIVTGSLDGTLRLWDGEDGRPLEVLHGHNAGILSLAVGPNGERLVSGSKDRTLRLWDGRPGSSVTPLHGEGGGSNYLYGVRFSPDGSRLAWLSARATLRVSDARSGEDLCSLAKLWRPVRAFAFDAGGARLFTAGLDDRVRVWSAETGEFLENLTDTIPGNCSGDFSPYGTLYASGPARWEGSRFVPPGQEYRLSLWSLETGEIVRAFDVDRPLGIVRFSPDGRLVASSSISSDGGAIYLHDVETGERLHTLDAGEDSMALAFDPSGRRLASVTYEGTDQAVWIWDVESGRLERALRGHAQPTSLAFGPDGRRLVTGNVDGTISLWDPERGEVASFMHQAQPVVAVAFAPDGRRIASAGLGGDHRIWDVTPVAERGAVRRAAAVRRALRPQAEPLVDELFERLYLPSDVVRSLEEEPGLRPDLRQGAIRLARCRVFNSVVGPANRAFEVCSRADATPDEYLKALEVCEVLCELSSDLDIENLTSTPLTCLGLAELRMGRYRKALATLGRAETSHGESYYSWGPGIDRLLIGMCHLALGEEEEGRAAVDRAGELLDAMRVPPSENRREYDGARRLLAEARSMR